MKSFLFLAVLTLSASSFAQDQQPVCDTEIRCAQNFFGEFRLYSELFNEETQACEPVISGHFGPGIVGQQMCEEALKEIQK